MLDPIMNFFEKLISDFTWKRLFFIAVVFSLATSALWMYESYTGNFKITRLERTAELIEKLAELRAKPLISEDEELRSAYAGVKAQLEELANSKREPIFMHPRIKQGLFAALPWLILSIIFSLAKSDEKGSTRSTLFGVSIIAVPLVVLLMFLPSYENTWVNYWLLPWLALIICMTVIILVWGRKRKEGKRV